MKSKLTAYLITFILTTLISVPVKAADLTEKYSNNSILNNKIGYNLTSKNTALIVIDVQKNFIPGLPECFMTEIPGQNTPNKLANVKKLMDVAKKTKMNTVVTYEAADFGDAAMPKELFESLPTQNIGQFIKTYFDITKKSSVSEFLKNSKVKNVIVCGAETDVCVTQSVRGLLNSGYNVFLANDASYTSTTHNAPALKFMEKSGANIYSTDTIIDSLVNKKPLYSNTKTFSSIPDMTSTNSAMVVINVDDKSLDNNSDLKKEAKIERIKFMTSLSRISNIPIYFIYDDDIDSLKDSLGIPDNATLIKVDKNLDYVKDSLVKELKEKNKTTIMVAGIDENSIMDISCDKFKANNFDTFLLEDGFFKDNITNYNDFSGFYNKNIIPSSLKLCFYDIVASVGLYEDESGIGVAYVDEGLNGTMTWIEALPFIVDSQSN